MVRTRQMLAAFLGGTTAVLGVGILTNNVTKEWINNKRNILFNKGLCENNNDVKQNTLIKGIKSNHEIRLEKSDILKQARCSVERFKEEHGCPGLVISVSVDGDNVWNEGFGFADVENNVYCKPNTVMRIASISKPLTATATMRLVEEGKLNLDDCVQQYVPNFPVKTINSKQCTITIRHLLSHLSGIRHYHKKGKGFNKKSESDGDVRDKYKSTEYYIKECYNSVEESLTLFKDDELVHEPGSKYLYTTYAWTLLSAVIEKAAQQNFLKHMNELFTELGMTRTSAEFHDTLIYNKARFYIRDSKGKLKNTPYVDNCYKHAGGGFLSTTPDLIKFGNAMLYSSQVINDQPELRPGILSPQSMSLSWQIVPKTENKVCKIGGYGLGWMIFPDKDKHGGCTNQRKAIFHTGV